MIVIVKIINKNFFYILLYNIISFKQIFIFNKLNIKKIGNFWIINFKIYDNYNLRMFFPIFFF